MCGLVSSRLSAKPEIEAFGRDGRDRRHILGPYRKCAGAVRPGEARIVSRRGICDREIWTKRLALAADAGELMGFACVFEDWWG